MKPIVARKKESGELELAKVLGGTIKALREKAGMTQVQLATAAKIDPSYMSQVERGLKNITLPVLWKLSRALNVGVGTIVSAVEKKHR
ncbi:MAG: helix-turn-helix transcriptional regulator [Deltaproteobacteria bacterium]|nr:helix-turn-helix transcriptional regulator [Deltaproteobacteria bacterium]